MKDLKEVVKFIVEALEAGIKRTIPEVAEALQALFPAVQGIKNINLADLDEAGKDEIIEYVKAELDLDDDKVEAIVEQALSVIGELAILIKLL